MAPPLRIPVVGRLSHVISRGNGGETSFAGTAIASLSLGWFRTPGALRYRGSRVLVQEVTEKMPGVKHASFAQGEIKMETGICSREHINVQSMIHECDDAVVQTYFWS